VLAGTGFRTAPAAHAEVQELFGRPVVSLRLVDPRFYHLDTCFCPLGREDAICFPSAFDRYARQVMHGVGVRMAVLDFLVNGARSLVC